MHWHLGCLQAPVTGLLLYCLRGLDALKSLAAQAAPGTWDLKEAQDSRQHLADESSNDGSANPPCKQFRSRKMKRNPKQQQQNKQVSLHTTCFQMPRVCGPQVLVACVGSSRGVDAHDHDIWEDRQQVEAQAVSRAAAQ